MRKISSSQIIFKHRYPAALTIDTRLRSAKIESQLKEYVKCNKVLCKQIDEKCNEYLVTYHSLGYDKFFNHNLDSK